MPDHRGMSVKKKLWTMLIGTAAVALLGVGSVVVFTASPGQASQSQGYPGGAQVGSVAEAAQSPGQPAAGAGPLSEVDKTFLIKVRQAGLWEIPAGRLAQTHATSEAVKRAGLHVLDGHSLLDQLVREDAALFGVQLPDLATPEQQDWDRQLTAAQGLGFDELFVSLLRASHGKIFATIAEVRASTQNDLIRRLARQANQTVMDHMEVLEDTGLVSQKTLEEVAAAVAPAPAK